MLRQVTLPESHYAAAWPANVVRKTAEITAIGCEYAMLPEGPLKAEKLTEILQSFHGYLLKYMSMILCGHLPYAKNSSGEINTDTQLLLRCFIPSGAQLNKVTLGVACRTLHLAFRGMKPPEVYDQLMLCLVKTIHRYDPAYTDKIRQVAQIISQDLHAKTKFTATDCNRYIDYDTARYLKLLAKRAFLIPHVQETGVETRFSRSETWPPPKSFFNAGPVGLPYFVSNWFRYFLVDWINGRMSEIESKEGVLQLDHRRQGNSDPSPIPHAQGEFTPARSRRSIAADISMLKMPVDIGEMNLDWVQGASGSLFETLTRSDRHLLYCVFARDMSWPDIARTFHMTVKEVRLWHNELLLTLNTKTKNLQAA